MAASGSSAWEQSRSDPVRIERRGGLADVTGVLQMMDRRGLSVESERIGMQLVTWDRIRRIHGADHPALDRWLAEGTDVWRARIRIGRGDPLSAEPLLQPIFDRYFREAGGRTDEMALVVAEGLLRCRIARGDNAGAIEPMLETIRLSGAGVTSLAYASLAPVVDRDARLVPAVPPAWPEATDRRDLASRLDTVRQQLEAAARDGSLDGLPRASAARTARVAACYLAAVRRERGEAAESLPDPGDDEGLRLLVACLGDAEARAALDAPPPPGTPVDPASLLEAASPAEEPAWIDDWTDFFTGLRQLGSDDVAERDRGLVTLLRLPAVHAVERPYLAGLALARAAAFLDRAGRPAEALILQRDLAARFRGHPALPALTAGRAGSPETPVP